MTNRIFMTKSFVLLLTMIIFSVTSCSEDNGDIQPDTDNEGPLYAALNAVQDPDGRVSFLHTTNQLGPDVKFDRSESLELPGNAYFMSRGDGKQEFFIANDEDLTINKWRISEEGEFEELETVSLQGVGTTSLWKALVFTSETEAHYIDGSSNQIIVINTEEMAIDRVLSLPSEFSQNDGLFATFSDWEVVNDKIFIPVGWTDYDNTLGQSTGVVIVDTETDQIDFIEDDRLAGAIDVVKMNNDDLYFGTGWTVVYDQEGRENSRKSGFLRIKAGETSFDPDYFVEVSELGSADAFQSPVNNKVYMRILDQSKQSWDGDVAASDYFDDFYQIGLVDVITGEVEILSDMPHTKWLNLFNMDGDVFLRTSEPIADNPEQNNVVKLSKASSDGKSFSDVYECSECRFIQNIERLR